MLCGTTTTRSRARGHSLAKAPVDCRIRTLTELLQLFIRVQPAKGVARLKGRSEGEGRGGEGRGKEGRGEEEKRGERGIKMCAHKVQEIVESLQQVKHKGGSRPPIRTLGMGDVSGDCENFATCNPFQGF